MNIYILDIDIKTPLLIADSLIGNVIKVTRYPYIPASTIRGAILSKLYREYKIKEVNIESSNPSFSIRPAYPVVNGLITKPPHKLMYRCKLCHKEERVILDKIFNSKNTLRNFNYENYYPPYKCQNGHVFSISEVKSLVYLKMINGKWRYIEYSPDIIQIESIGINRGIGGTEIGMLYSYIALKPGLKYRTLIHDDIGRLDEWIKNLPKTDDYFIGRSISRGMGLCRISIKETDTDEYIKKRKEKIREIIKYLDGLLILRALSPILSFSNNGLTYKINLTNIGLKPHPIYKNYNYIPTQPILIKGFSISKYVLPKIAIKGLGPGTLYFYEVSEDLDRVSEKIAKLELKGFSPPYNIGLNILEVYDDVKYIIH